MTSAEGPARLDLPPAMRDGACRSVFAALGGDGAEVRFVGGCVRDALAGRRVGDVDLATPDPPDRVMALLRKVGLKAVPTGIAHGTITAVAEGRGFEVTTLRRDVRTFGRHADVAFTDDWQADAARRDFTFNAMSAGQDGTLHDYFNGRADLAAGRVRFVGDPATRIAEDYLRVLRFFRFLAHFGRAAPDDAALAACAAAAQEIRRLSAERVRTEVLKLLAAPDPLAALGLMRTTGVLAVVLPEAAGFERLAALLGIDDGDPLRRLAALVAGEPGAVAARLKLSNAERERLVSPAPGVVPAAAPGDEAEIRRVLYRYGATATIDAAHLAWAQALAARPADAEAVTRGWRRTIELARVWQRPSFPVKGRDVLALGVPHGPEISRLLKAVEAWWIAADFRPDRPACLAELERQAADR